MSGLVGVVHWDGRPVDERDLCRRVSRLAYRGLDAQAVWVNGQVGLGIASLQSTPESIHERQPALDHSGAIAATLDGRFDNRAELIEALGLSNSRAPLTDPELLVAAYERWGLECPARLLGDFAFVIWDSRARRLFAARDIFGLRPFYYRAIGSSLWWASDQRSLVWVAPATINEGMIAEHLSCQIASHTETLYEGLLRLPMAHALTVSTSNAIRSWRYWRPDPDRVLRCRDDREYDEAFRSVFREAVCCRLRARGPVVLMLSGGIDSGAIAGQIRELRDAGTTEAASVETVSMILPGHPFNEQPNIEEVVRRTGLPSHQVAADSPAEEDLVADAERFLEPPEFPILLIARPLRRAARELGARVLLTGTGGDEWFFGTTEYAADLLRRGRFVQMMRRIVDDCSLIPRLGFARMLLLTPWTALPRPARAVGRRILRRRLVPPWISPAFARRHALEERLRHVHDDDGVEFQSREQYAVFHCATNAAAAYAFEPSERGVAGFGLEQCHPFFDRRVVELALALPATERRDHGMPKRIVRRAMGKWLATEAVSLPKPPFDCESLILDFMARLRDLSVIDRLEPVRRGWVDKAAMAQLWDEAGVNILAREPLWSAIGITCWLRTGPDRNDVAGT